VRILLAAYPVLLTTPVWAGSNSHPAKQPIPTDPGYVFALAAASHFLQAWQTGDLENGMVLLSDGIRHTQSTDKLDSFFRVVPTARLRSRAAMDIKANTVSRSCSSLFEAPTSAVNLLK
jgi:hypothetical protein